MAIFGNTTEKEYVKSSITDVTVYMQGAQVFRKASYTIKPGISEIIIDGICPTIDPKSLQVKASGNLIIIDSKYSLYYPKPEPVKTIDGIPLKIKKDISLLEDSIQSISFELLEIQDEIDVLMAQKNIIANNGAIRGQGKVNDSIQLLKQAIEYYHLKMNEINKKLQILNRKKTDKNSKKSAMQIRLTNLQNYQNSEAPIIAPKGPIHRITVTVSSNEIVSGKLQLSYLVSSAGWTPLYDLKSDLQVGKVNLTYKAQIFQNTGNDWDNVKISVSTNNPYQNKIKPTLHPWYLSYYNNQMNTSVGGYPAAPSLREEKLLKKPIDAMSDSKDYDAFSSAQFTQMIDQVISAEFKIDLPYTIKSNNEQHLVLIKNHDLDADYKYYTVPKLDPSVYLMALVTNLDDLKLVPAKANIFFDGTYMGETYIDPTQMDDTLTLSLGKDPNILVKRTLLKKECKDKIIGSSREKSKSFEIEIRNNKANNIELIVQDQVPVTQHSEIQIEVLNKGKASLDEVTGLLEWKVNLKAKETEKIHFSYKVKYDKNINLNF